MTAQLICANVVPNKTGAIVATVLRLVEYSNRETLAILSSLTARAARGERIDLALCLRSNGEEKCLITGAYLANPALGVNAAFRLAQRFTQMQQELI